MYGCALRSSSEAIEHEAEAEYTVADIHKNTTRTVISQLELLMFSPPGRE